MNQPAQQQSVPGSTGAMTPHPDHGEDNYVGTGRLAGKVVLLTGGDSGIGKAVASAYAREGADLVISYLGDHDDAQDTAQWVQRAGRRAVPGDLAEPVHCRSVVAQMLADRGIRSNSIAPGPVWTPLIPATMPPVQGRLLRRTGAHGAPRPAAELAPVSVMLASDEASYISGARTPSPVANPSSDPHTNRTRQLRSSPRRGPLRRRAPRGMSPCPARRSPSSPPPRPCCGSGRSPAHEPKLPVPWAARLPREGAHHPGTPPLR